MSSTLTQISSQKIMGCSFLSKHDLWSIFVLKHLNNIKKKLIYQVKKTQKMIQEHNQTE